MHLRIRVPSEIFWDVEDVSRLVAETENGCFGIWPHRLDCVAVLVPSVLVFQLDNLQEQFIAVDEGVLIKIGPDVKISVRNAAGGGSLDMLRASLAHEDGWRKKSENASRKYLNQLEGQFFKRFWEMLHEK
jgi:F-type H+-transporting ATPase subunit epsilon